jgi:integrase
MRTRTKGIQTVDGGKVVNKQYRGERIFARLGPVSQDEAEAWLRTEQSRIDAESQQGARRLFCDAAKKYLIECQQKKVRSIEMIAYHVELLLPYVGEMELRVIHTGSFDEFREARLEEDEVKPATVNRSLEVARTILIRAARVWRDEQGRPWLDTAPLIEMLKEDPRPPYPITWDQQEKLLAEQPDHLIDPLLFAVNTGTREENIAGLQWSWERRIPELQRSVFLVPAGDFKSDRVHVIILNDIAQSVVDRRRGKHPKYVFTYTDVNKGLPPDRMTKLNSKAYRKARKRAGLNMVRVHDLRHTFGQRLRAAGVSKEDRDVIMGHATQEMSQHYATPTIPHLVEMANRVLQKRDTPTVLRLVANG